jgi:hypothetical protein
VPSEKQILANRRNARRSTGPRSGAGKKRASRNSYRHGLTAGVTSNTERARQIERLARKIAGNTTVGVALEWARAVAQAEFDLAQIRRVRVALISCAMAFDGIESSASFQSLGEINRFFKGLDRGELVLPERGEAPAMPRTEPARTAEAVRRALPELVKLDRYERRAAGRRARAAHLFLDSTTS